MNIYLLPLNKATGALAQLVEQRTENPCVPGSIPGGTTIKKPIQLNRFFWFYKFINKPIYFLILKLFRDMMDLTFGSSC